MKIIKTFIILSVLFLIVVSIGGCSLYRHQVFSFVMPVNDRPFVYFAISTEKDGIVVYSPWEHRHWRDFWNCSRVANGEEFGREQLRDDWR